MPNSRSNSAISARKTRLAKILLPIFAFAALLSWALASPVGASPDDDFHLPSIWCAEGERIGLCEKDTSTTRVVPSDLYASPSCYARNAAESAQCQGEEFGEPPHQLSPTDRGNFAGEYPPVFYATMSKAISADINVSVITMRVLNGALFVGLVAATFAALPARLRPALLLSSVITAVPLAMFMIPSVNPSSWAIISATTLWVSLLGYFETRGLRSAALGSLALLSTVIGAGARADAAVYAGVAVLVVVILKLRFTRDFFYKLSLPAIIGAISLAFFLSSKQTHALDGWGNRDEVVDIKRLNYDNFLNMPDLLAGVFGKWGLGWLDTMVPALVWVAGTGIFFTVCFFGLGFGGIRKALAIIVVLLSLWLIPTYILMQSKVSVGSDVQPRYLLPLIIMLAGVCLLRNDARPVKFNISQTIALIIGISAANATALHVNLRRYVTGNDHGGINLDAGAEWWWNILIGPTAVWFIGSVAFAAVVTTVVYWSSSIQPSVRMTELER